MRVLLWSTGGPVSFIYGLNDNYYCELEVAAIFNSNWLSLAGSRGSETVSSLVSADNLRVGV